MINKNISRVYEDGDLIMFRSHCGCHLKECDHELSVEYDKGYDVVSVEIYANLNWISEYEDRWFFQILDRIKCCFKLLFTGKLQVMDSFLFIDKESVEHYILALQEGLEKMKRLV